MSQRPNLLFILTDDPGDWAMGCAGNPEIRTPNLRQAFHGAIQDPTTPDETQLREFIRENNLPWRQILSGEGWKSPIARQFGIRAIPAPWLISRDGRLISPHARGAELDQLVATEIDG